MKRSTVLAMLLVTFGLASEAGDPKGLDGLWKPISAEVAGIKFPEAELAKISLQIDGEKYIVKVDKVVDKGTVKCDSTKKPFALDITGIEGPNKGKTMLAICEIDKDMMRVCYDLAGKNRPTEFATSKEKPFFLAVYQRAKK